MEKKSKQVSVAPMGKEKQKLSRYPCPDGQLKVLIKSYIQGPDGPKKKNILKRKTGIRYPGGSKIC